MAGEGVARVDADRVAEMLGDILADLLRRDEQIGGAVGIDQGISQRDRSALDVLPAHVEGPGDRVERGQDRGVGLGLGQPVGDFLALVGGRTAGEKIGLDHQARVRGQRPVGPDRIDGVGVDRDQGGAFLGKRPGRLFDPGLGVEPGIVADPRALGRMLGQPGCDAGLRDRLITPLIGGNLFTHLQGVTAVDEDRGLGGQHGGGAGRTLEAGQPGKALGVGADIFGHMLVGERHDEAVETAAGKLFAQSLETIGIAGHKGVIDLIASRSNPRRPTRQPGIRAWRIGPMPRQCLR